MLTPSIGRNLSFGRIALRAGLVTPGRLDELLIEQDQLRREGERYKIGELCQQRGALTSGQVQKVLLAQEFYRMRQDDELLAGVLEGNATVPAEVLQAALDEQLATYRSESKVPHGLGELLVSRGALDAKTLAAVRASNPDLARAAKRGLTEILHIPERLPDEAPQPTGWLTVEVAEGPTPVFPIVQKAILGRDPANEIPLDDPRSSRQHARIDWRPDQLKHLLIDLNSINGTWVNGQRVTKPTPLRARDRIRIGDTHLFYDVRGPDTRSAQARPGLERRAIPDTRKHLTVHERLQPEGGEEEIPVAEVVSPSPFPEGIPFSAAADADPPDPKIVEAAKVQLRHLVDLKLAGRITPEEYQRRREQIVSRL